jgi:hypothetical protein
MSNINLKQCDQCGAVRDANSAFCGNCGKQFNISGENFPTPLFGEHQQGPITPRLSNPGLYTPSQPGYASPPPPRYRSNRIYLVVIALLVLMLIGTFVFFLGTGRSQEHPNTASTQNQVGTKPANNNVTSTVATASPTALTTTPTDLTATPDLTATTAGLTLAPAETLPENITLKCDCTDRVVVTITKIVVQPQQNRMVWSLTFYNNSQSDADAVFNQFSLQKGDQVNYPTQGEQTYDATGGGISTDVPLQAGETKQAILTFSFVPYKAMPYTLSSEFQDYFIHTVIFNPVVIQF